MFQNTTTIDIGLSDFHKLVLTSFRSKHDPGKPKEVIYRDYKKFNNDTFREELGKATILCNDYDDFETKYLKILDKHAPMKKKTIRANHAPFMSKGLRKSIMKRTQLANKYHKSCSEQDYENFKKQKNFVNRLSKREKKSFYMNLSVNNLLDNKKFWKNMKPLFSDKSKSSNTITLVKNDNIISKDEEVAKEFSDFFSNAVENLNIPEIEIESTEHLTNPIEIAIEKYKNHPSKFPILSLNKSNTAARGVHHESGHSNAQHNCRRKINTGAHSGEQDGETRTEEKTTRTG